MDANVTHVDTVLVLTSIIETTLFIPWFFLLFLVWIWQRCFRSKYQTWAWDEILARIGNPAPFITTQINPSEAGDIQLLTDYRHLVSELLFKIRDVPINMKNILTLGLYLVLGTSGISHFYASINFSGPFEKSYFYSGHFLLRSSGTIIV